MGTESALRAAGGDKPRPYDKTEGVSVGAALMAARTAPSMCARALPRAPGRLPAAGGDKPRPYDKTEGVPVGAAISRPPVPGR